MWVKESGRTGFSSGRQGSSSGRSWGKSWRAALLALGKPTLGFPLNLLPLDFHSRRILVYHSYYTRKATKKTVANRMHYPLLKGICFHFWLNWFSLILTWICWKEKSQTLLWLKYFIIMLSNGNPQGSLTIINIIW